VPALVVAGAFFLSGCGGTNSSPQDAAPQAAPPPAAAQAPPAAAAGQPAHAEAAPAAPALAAPAETPAPASGALAQEHESGVEVTLVELKRTGGDSLTAEWRYRNTTSAAVKISKGGSSWLDPYQLTAAAFLIDPVNKKKYLVITDDQKYPLASKHGDWQGVTLEPGQSLSAWAKFPAPPADVEQVTVTIAGVPPYEDVPIVK
jgi:pyruvate/2-oxoglutarate dehydrogenase complex dihydrolipoamide acyltransferase (E2) component